MKSAKELFRNINFVFKLVEWILCLIMCVFGDDLDDNFRLRDLVLASSAAYFIITFSLFLVYIFENTNILYELIAIFVGAILLLVTGLCCIIYHYSHSARDYEYSDGKMLIVHRSDKWYKWIPPISSIFAIACGVVMLVDWLFLFRKRKE
ncbi:hypothetical protein QE152_g38383 [Popillia japonica]|uniref:NADH dehydrogenase subunit 6 n=1 Tax=Popillia japonica TaxID=7064 RepID=A0AAW1HXG6_POPJA